MTTRDVNRLLFGIGPNPPRLLCCCHRLPVQDRNGDKMKTSACLTFLIVLGFASAVYAASGAAAVTVTVKHKDSGKTVYRAPTDAAGKFATANLQPGSYNVEFQSAKGSGFEGKQLSISLSGGKGAPRKAYPAVGKHLRSGVAVSINLPSISTLAGEVLVTGNEVPEGAAPAGMEKVRANVKVINGKRYVWVQAPIGSNMGGKWVEAGTEGAVLATDKKRREDAEAWEKLRNLSEDVGPPRGNPASDRR